MTAGLLFKIAATATVLVFPLCIFMAMLCEMTDCASKSGNAKTARAFDFAISCAGILVWPLIITIGVAWTSYLIFHIWTAVPQ